MDDILSYEKDFKEHVLKIRTVLERCRKHGISISENKFKFVQAEVKYVGYRINTEGTSLDGAKLKAIESFPNPTNKTELRSFMGLVNQMSKHSNELSGVALPSRTLLKKK